MYEALRDKHRTLRFCDTNFQMPRSRPTPSSSAASTPIKRVRGANATEITVLVSSNLWLGGAAPVSRLGVAGLPRVIDNHTVQHRTRHRVDRDNGQRAPVGRPNGAIGKRGLAAIPERGIDN